MTPPYRLAVAGRYAERHMIKQLLLGACLDILPVQLTASWLDCHEKEDGDLTDEQAVLRATINRGEIASAHALLYVPSWQRDAYDELAPRWSPGRLIDYGMALACRIPLIIVGRPEPSIYFRGELVTVCDWGTVRETVRRVLNLTA